MSSSRLWIESSCEQRDEECCRTPGRSLPCRREALTNVPPPLGSGSVVKMDWRRGILIEVSDEGRGFAASRGGLRLVGMRRAAGIGGRLEVVSTKDRGTRFLFGRTAPLPVTAERASFHL